MLRCLGLARLYSAQTARHLTKVQCHVKITKAQSPEEVLRLINNQDNIETLTYGLRVIGRYASSNIDKTVSALRSPSYQTLKQKVFKNTAALTSQEVSDIYYWERNMSILNKSLLTLDDIQALDSRITELVQSNSFVVHHLFSLFFDMGKVRRFNSALEGAVYKHISNRDNETSLIDLKLVVATLDIYRYPRYYSLLANVNYWVFKAVLEHHDFKFLIDFYYKLIIHADNCSPLGKSIKHIGNYLIQNVGGFREDDYVELFTIFSESSERYNLLFDKATEVLMTKLREKHSFLSPLAFCYIANTILRHGGLKRFITDSFIDTFGRALFESAKESKSYYKVFKALELFNYYHSIPADDVVKQAVGQLKNLMPNFASERPSAFSALCRYPFVNLEKLFDPEQVKADFMKCGFHEQIILLVRFELVPIPDRWKEHVSQMKAVFLKSIETVSESYVLTRSIYKFKPIANALYTDICKDIKVAILKRLTELNRASNQKIKLAAVFSLLPSCQAEVLQYLTIARVSPVEIPKGIRKLERDFPFAALVDLLMNKPEYVTYNILMELVPFLSKDVPAESVAKYAELLSSDQDLPVSSRLLAIQAAQLVRKIHDFGLNPKAFSVLLRKLDASLRNASDQSMTFQTTSKLAVELKRIGYLEKHTAARIIETRLGQNLPSKEFIEIASVAFDVLSFEKVRTHIITPFLSHDSFFEYVPTQLASFLKWPHYEGELEVRYGDRAAETIEKTSSMRILCSMLRELEYYPLEPHADLINKIEVSLAITFRASIAKLNPASNLKFAEAFIKSSTINQSFVDIITEAFLAHSDRYSLHQKTELHSLLYKKRFRVPEIAESISRAISSLPNLHDRMLHNFAFQLADLNLTGTPWADEVIPLIADSSSVLMPDYGKVNLLFALIRSKSSLDLLKKWAALTNFETDEDFLKALVFDYLSTRAVIEPSSHIDKLPHYDPVTNVFGIPKSFIESIAEALRLASIPFEYTRTVNGIQIPLYLPTLSTSIWPLTNKSFTNGHKEAMHGRQELYLDQVKQRGLAVVSVRSKHLHNKKPQEIVDALMENGLKT
mmetsp:Transcript_16821/g.30063  ORF Transcript_16821/g.30063 Transcript_16821/m.30063 type:complete len:1067 (+) Transcript_16821:7189-10389(+)